MQIPWPPAKGTEVSTCVALRYTYSALPSLLDGSSSSPTFLLARSFVHSNRWCCLPPSGPASLPGGQSRASPSLPRLPSSAASFSREPCPKGSPAQGPPPLCFKEPEPGQPLASPPE